MKALDYETFLILPGLVTPEPVVMSVADESSERLLTPAEANKEIRRLHASGELIAVANGPFDFGVAVADDPSLLPLVFELYERGQILDTHIRQPLKDIGHGTLLQDKQGSEIRSYSLAIIADKELGLSLAKENTPRLTYARLKGVPFELWSQEERDYSKKDARVTYDAVEAQGRLFGAEAPEDPGIQNLALQGEETRAQWATHLMSAWGPRTDPDMVAHVTEQVEAAHQAALVKFTEAGIYRGEGWCRREKRETYTRCRMEPHLYAAADCWKPWLPSAVGTRDGEVLKAMVEAAYQGQPPRTPSEGVSTDRDTLLESGDDLLMVFGESGVTETERKTYLGVIARGVAVPINVRYDPIKKTARGGARDPNLQNLPRGGHTRECFVPRNFRHPDRTVRSVYCSTDYPSLELWTLAETCLDMFGWSALADGLRKGEDMHARLYGMVDGLAYEEARRRYKAGDARASSMRQAAKPINYGLGGGMGAEKLTLFCRQPANGGVRFCKLEGFKCGEEKYFSEKLRRPMCRRCVDICGRFREAWYSMLPEMRDYHKAIGDVTDEGGLVDVLAPEGLPKLWCAGRRFSAAANLKFQGRAARAAKTALWLIAKASYVDKASPLYGARPTMFVHDEIISEIPESFAHEAAFEQARLMGEALRTWCPKVYNDKACPEPALARRWFKKAEKVFDKHKRLKPWWPEKWNWAPDAEIMAGDLRA